MALVGGIGSGKTTELQLTYKLLARHEDAINIYVDLGELTDLNALNPGAILIAIGRQLYKHLSKADEQSDQIKAAYKKLGVLARGETTYVAQDQLDPDEYFEDDPGPSFEVVHTPGLLKPRFPAIQRNVEEVCDLVIEIAKPLLESERQITVLIDGLDRLIRPERFREFTEQDLRALRGTQISIIVAAPLLLWFDKTRFLQDYFYDFKHIPAAIADPEKSDFLKQVLVRRGARDRDLMDEDEISELSRFSGGVLRDLIALARTSADAAYRDDKDRISPAHVRSAIRQLGKRYLTGLGKIQRKLINHLLENGDYSTEDPVCREMLINRRVLEHCAEGRDYFSVHPALAEVLKESG